MMTILMIHCRRCHCLDGDADDLCNGDHDDESLWWTFEAVCCCLLFQWIVVWRFDWRLFDFFWREKSWYKLMNSGFLDFEMWRSTIRGVVCMLTQSVGCVFVVLCFRTEVNCLLVLDVSENVLISAFFTKNRQDNSSACWDSPAQFNSSATWN